MAVILKYQIAEYNGALDYMRAAMAAMGEASGVVITAT